MWLSAMALSTCTTSVQASLGNAAAGEVAADDSAVGTGGFDHCSSQPANPSRSTSATPSRSHVNWPSTKCRRSWRVLPHAPAAVWSSWLAFFSCRASARSTLRGCTEMPNRYGNVTLSRLAIEAGVDLDVAAGRPVAGVGGPGCAPRGPWWYLVGHHLGGAEPLGATLGAILPHRGGRRE